MMNKINATRCLIQWAIELGQFDIEYKPWVAIKAQVLADFIAKFTHPQDKKDSPKRTWMIQTDGSSTKNAKGAGVVLVLEGKIMKYAVRLQFLATNNEAEYEAFLTGLKLARVVATIDVIVQADSQLVIG